MSEERMQLYVVEITFWDGKGEDTFDNFTDVAIKVQAKNEREAMILGILRVEYDDKKWQLLRVDLCNPSS